MRTKMFRPTAAVLPDRTYTIQAWHAKAGTRTRQVTVVEKESEQLGFPFAAAAN